MSSEPVYRCIVVACLLLVHAGLLPVVADAVTEETETSRLVVALLGETPLIDGGAGAQEDFAALGERGRTR